MHYLLLIISIVFIVPSVFAQVDNSLVLHYEFENNVEDTSTYENDGVINSEVTYTDGIIGKAIMLNGSNSDYIYLGHYEIFDADFIQGNISIASWVKGSSYWIFSNYNCSGIYAFQFVDGFVKFVFTKNWGDDVIIKTDESINNEEFHHIAVTTENNIFRIYIDGIKVKEESHDDNRLSWCSQTEFNSSGVLINACGIKPNSNPPIPGWGPYPDQTIYLDDLRIYNRTMSDTEILQLFEMKNQNTNTCEYNDEDTDGVIDQWDKCPNTPANSAVYSNGCRAQDLYDLTGEYESLSKTYSIITDKYEELSETIESMFTKEQMENMVSSILEWGDYNEDGKVTLQEIIQKLMIISGVITE